jgi:hypothetical protein
MERYEHFCDGLWGLTLVLTVLWVLSGAFGCTIQRLVMLEAGSGADGGCVMVEQHFSLGNFRFDGLTGSDAGR